MFFAKNAILIVAIVFGVFHMSVVKFLTTALLGYVFAYIAHKSKNIANFDGEYISGE